MAKALLPTQGAWVGYLVGELDPTAATKTWRRQMSKYLKKKKKKKPCYFPLSNKWFELFKMSR